MGIVIFIVLLIVILVAVNEDSSKSFKNPTTNHESHDRFFKNALGEEVLVMSFFPSAEYANYFWHGMENIKERINKDGIFNFIEKDHPKLPFKMKSGYVKLETSWKDEKDEEFFMIFIVPKKHVDYFGQVYKEEFVEKKDEIKRLSEKGVLSDKEVIDIISIVFEMLNDVIHQEGHEMLIYTMNNVKLLCSKKTLPEDLNFIEEKIVFKMDNFNQKVEELTDNIKNLCHSNISQNDFNFIEKETINMMRIVFGTNKNNIKERFKELEKNIKAFYPKGMSQEELDFINKKLKHLEENINPLETFNDPLSISDSSDSFCLGDDTENTIIDTEFPSEETREEIQIDDAFVDDSFSTSGSSN